MKSVNKRWKHCTTLAFVLTLCPISWTKSSLSLVKWTQFLHLFRCFHFKSHHPTRQRKKTKLECTLTFTALTISLNSFKVKNAITNSWVRVRVRRAPSLHSRRPACAPCHFDMDSPSTDYTTAANGGQTQTVSIKRMGGSYFGDLRAWSIINVQWRFYAARTSDYIALLLWRAAGRGHNANVKKNRLCDD